MFLSAFVILIGAACGSTLTSSLTHAEQQQLTLKLQQNQNDLTSIYYAVTGLQALGKEPNHAETTCKMAIDKVVQDNAESIFQFSEIVKTLKCKVYIYAKFPDSLTVLVLISIIKYCIS